MVQRDSSWRLARSMPPSIADGGVHNHTHEYHERYCMLRAVMLDTFMHVACDPHHGESSHGAQHTAAICPYQDAIMAQRLHYHDELRQPAQLGGEAGGKEQYEAWEKVVKPARKVVATNSASPSDKTTRSVFQC
jgi:hypothetical protein